MTVYLLQAHAPALLCIAHPAHMLAQLHVFLNIPGRCAEHQFQMHQKPNIYALKFAIAGFACVA